MALLFTHEGDQAPRATRARQSCRNRAGYHVPRQVRHSRKCPIAGSRPGGPPTGGAVWRSSTWRRGRDDVSPSRAICFADVTVSGAEARDYPTLADGTVDLPAHRPKPVGKPDSSSSRRNATEGAAEDTT